MVPGYQPYYGTEEITSKMGVCVCVFVKEGLKFMERNDLNRKIAIEGNKFQSRWIEIVNDNNPNMKAGLFYRHPRKNFGDEFLENLKATLKTIRKQK